MAVQGAEKRSEPIKYGNGKIFHIIPRPVIIIPIDFDAPQIVLPPANRTRLASSLFRKNHGMKLKNEVR